MKTIEIDWLGWSAMVNTGLYIGVSRKCIRKARFKNHKLINYALYRYTFKKMED